MSSLPDIHRPNAVDLDLRLRAVTADLEYFRVKRLEPRVLHLVRRGVISLNDLIRAGRDGAGDRTSEAVRQMLGSGCGRWRTAWTCS